jgi:hypothetical protein
MVDFIKDMAGRFPNFLIDIKTFVIGSIILPFKKLILIHKVSFAGSSFMYTYNTYRALLNPYVLK